MLNIDLRETYYEDMIIIDSLPSAKQKVFQYN